MSLARAATFLLLRSFKNRLARHARRVREPRYLISTAIGLIYLFYVIRWRVFGAGAPLAAADRPFASLVLAGFALTLVAGAWVFGDEEGAVAFTEAEVQFLFPAPVTRRGLLHYKLLRSLVFALVSALLLTLFASTRLSPRPLFFALGAWLCLGTLALHVTAAALARASLVEHGVSGLRRRALTVVVVLGALGAVGYGAIVAAGPLPGTLSEATLARWATDALDSRALRWPLFPVLAPVGVLLARDVGELLAALPGALAVLGAHYAWALSSGVAFEQASAEAAERRARRAAAGGRRGVFVRRGKPPFALAAAGPPWVALTWKNAIASTRLIQLRLVIVLSVMIVAGSIVALEVLDRGSGGRYAALGVVCGAIAAYLALLGPQMFDMDLRLDFAQLDVLRAMPLSGRDVVAGALLAPVALLALGECVLLFLGATLSLGAEIPSLSFGERYAVALAAGLVLGALTACGFVVQTAGVLLFPAWVAADRQASRGIEAFGQRIFMLFGRLVVVVFGVVPASVPAGLAALVLWPVLGFYCAPIAAVLGVTVLVVELELALRGLGRAFERFDVSR